MQTILEISTTTPQPTIFDPNEALQMFQHNQALMQEILSELVQDLPRRQQQITMAITAENFVELHYHVHKLHGAIVYCGAPRLRAATQALEEILHTAQYAKIAEYYPKLLQEIENFILAYRTYAA